MGRDSKNVEWKERMEEQNMRFEINYNIKTSDLISMNSKDKKWMLKSCAGDNANHEEDHGGIHLCRFEPLPLSSLSGSAPNNAR